ncbi:hypothetical protein V8C86DRAFT_2547987 [Haematococcus lacustris]
MNAVGVNAGSILQGCNMWSCGDLCSASRSPRSSKVAALVLLALLCLAPPACAARLVHQRKGVAPDTLRAWQSLLVQQTNATTFEEAFGATFDSGGGNSSRTLSQYNSLVQWLIQSPNTAFAQIHELHNYAIREIVYDAVQLANSPLNETATLTVLDYLSSRLAQVSSRLGYPVARRVILGALVKQRIERGPFSRPVQLQVDKLLLQLFQLHKKSIANKGAVQFFHISKSGGTNLCQSAETNGCQTESFGERQNCMVRKFFDQPRWVATPEHKRVESRLTGKAAVSHPWFVNFQSDKRAQLGCAARWALLKEQGWNFYANEFTLPPGEQSLCKEFVNLLMFREPLARLSSQISWIQKLYKTLSGKERDIRKAFSDRSSAFWERLLPAGVNNYYIRSLLGSQYFEHPIKPIDDSLVQQAKVQVLLHDLLLTLENKPFNDITLKVGLGWEFSLQDGNIRSSHDIADEITMPTDYELLKARNLPDVQVYKFARELQALDVLLFNFVQLLDSKLGLQNLSTQQCGYVSLQAR